MHSYRCCRAGPCSADPKRLRRLPFEHPLLGSASGHKNNSSLGERDIIVGAFVACCWSCAQASQGLDGIHCNPWHLAAASDDTLRCYLLIGAGVSPESSFKYRSDVERELHTIKAEYTRRRCLSVPFEGETQAFLQSLFVSCGSRTISRLAAVAPRQCLESTTKTVVLSEAMEAGCHIDARRKR